MKFSFRRYYARWYFNHITCSIYISFLQCVFSSQGDSVVKYFELVEEDPYVHYLNTFQTNESARSLNMMPKHALNVNNCEVARFFKVHAKGLVEPISFMVPRKVCGAKPVDACFIT